MPDLSNSELALTALIFVWSGFVRSGLGFGGAALALPLMLLVLDKPVFWLPVVATHLLIFSTLTLYGKLGNIDWEYLKSALTIMFIPKIAGVLGLLNLPDKVLLNLIYGITLLYGLTYAFNLALKSSNRFADSLLLVMGAYASGTSLIGAPLISAVFARHVALNRLRDTLFMLWIILVVIKMSTFILLKVDLNFRFALYLLPFVAVGHWFGLKIHTYLIEGEGHLYKIILGVIMIVICGYGLLHNLF